MGSPRSVSPCNLYHVTSRGVGGQIIFEDNADRRHFLSLLKKAKDEYGLKIAAWCLMGNHFHLLVYSSLPNLSLAMKQLKERYSSDTNKRYDRKGHLFQSVFSSHPIDSESYLVGAVNYIHDNPVRAGIVNNAADYPWSSFHEYSGEKKFLVDDELIDSGCEDTVLTNCTKPLLCVLYPPRALDDDRTADMVREILNLESPTLVKGYDRGKRKEAILKLLDVGLTKSQVARITGISKSVISRLLSDS